jgi:hypothetical protein
MLYNGSLIGNCVPPGIGVEICRSAVDVVAPENISEKYGVKLCGFEFLGKGDPMLDAVIFTAFVAGVVEEAWVQVSWCLHGEGIEDELFLWSHVDACCPTITHTLSLKTIQEMMK